MGDSLRRDVGLADVAQFGDGHVAGGVRDYAVGNEVAVLLRAACICLGLQFRVGPDRATVCAPPVAAG